MRLAGGKNGMSFSLDICQAWQAMFNNPLLMAKVTVTCLMNNSGSNTLSPYYSIDMNISALLACPINDSHTCGGRHTSHLNYVQMPVAGQCLRAVDRQECQQVLKYALSFSSEEHGCFKLRTYAKSSKLYQYPGVSPPA